MLRIVSVREIYTFCGQPVSALHTPQATPDSPARHSRHARSCPSGPHQRPPHTHRDKRLTGTTVLNTSPGARSAAGDGAPLAVLLLRDVPSAAARARTE